MRKKKEANNKAERGILSILKSIVKQGYDLDRLHAESKRLERELRSINSKEEEIELHSGSSAQKGNSTAVSTMLKRLHDQKTDITLKLANCADREILCQKELQSLRSQAHSVRIQLLANQTDYNNADTELMLFRRVRIRRQKQLAWNMIGQRESYIRKVIIAAHDLWLVQR